MKLPLMICLALVAGLTACSQQQNSTQEPPAALSGRQEPLPTGRFIDQVFARNSQDVGSSPVNLISSPDGRFAVASDAGYRVTDSLWSIDSSDGHGVWHIDYTASRRDSPTNGLYYGLAFAPDGTLYAAQGAHDMISVLKLGADGHLKWLRSITTQEGDSPAGLALDQRGYLYVANNDPDTDSVAFNRPASVAIYQADTGKEVGRYRFENSFHGTPNYPLAVAVTGNGSAFYVSSERDGCVYVFNATDPKHLPAPTTLSTGANPTALLLNPAQTRLFVANSGSDTISEIDTQSQQILATVLLRPEIARGLSGATPLGMALSPDEKNLYVALADMNAVGVIDLSGIQPRLAGYIPVGWYPTAVALSGDGKRLLVSNAKGSHSHNVNPPPGQTRSTSPLALLEGTVAMLDVPPAADLPALTQHVLDNDRLTERNLHRPNPLAAISRSAGQITHVIYIVKENRSYDQVLGDLPQGNGKADYVLFGRDVTPNLHALAERFVLFDNFYCSGEVSGDGWTWSTQAMSNEYTQRNVPYEYSDRGRKFDFEGQTNDYPVGGFPATLPDGKPASEDPRFKNGAPAIPDVGAAPGGHIWDDALAAGITLRNYGFFMSNGVSDVNDKIVVPDNYPNSPGLQPGGRDLAGRSDLDFRRFDLDYPDSDATDVYFKQTGNADFLTKRRFYGQANLPSRFAEFKREFDLMLQKDASGAAVPNLMLVRMGTDHTSGMRGSGHTPRSMVADNDYAVGQMVDLISHSPIWNHTAILVIEDDAQNGPDHVDAHRSTCYVISPFIKAHSVDHSYQNTVSVIRTIELLLGLAPMNQYDAAADPVLDFDSKPSNAQPFAAIFPSAQIISERNIGGGPSSEPTSPELRPATRDNAAQKLQKLIDESSAMDFSHADRAPADALNRIIWASVKGPDVPLPPTPRGPVVSGKPPKPADDDDD